MTAILTVSAGLAMAAQAQVTEPSWADVMQPHRALYRVELADASGAAGLNDASGLIGFEFTASCEAYISSQRFYTQFVTSDGISSTSDIVLSAEEARDGSSYSFDIADHVNGQRTDHVAGQAEGQVIRFTAPIRHLGDLPDGTIFPTENTALLLEAAMAGEGFLETRVYDGGEEDEVYDIVARIEVLDTMYLPRPGSEGADALVRLPSWSISQSYYELQNTDGLPHYEVSYRMFANGIVDELVMDYGEYAFRARLVQLDYLDQPSC